MEPRIAVRFEGGPFEPGDTLTARAYLLAEEWHRYDSPGSLWLACKEEVYHGPDAGSQIVEHGHLSTALLPHVRTHSGPYEYRANLTLPRDIEPSGQIWWHPSLRLDPPLNRYPWRIILPAVGRGASPRGCVQRLRRFRTLDAACEGYSSPAVVAGIHTARGNLDPRFGGGTRGAKGSCRANHGVRVRGRVPSNEGAGVDPRLQRHRQFAITAFRGTIAAPRIPMSRRWH